MPMQFKIENQHALKDADTQQNLFEFPEVGLSLDWAGFLFCMALDSRGLTLGVDEAPASKVPRLKALPRSAFELQLVGKHLTYKYAPLLEVVSSLKGKGFSKDKFLEEVLLQLEAVPTPLQAVAQLRPAKPQTKPTN